MKIDVPDSSVTLRDAGISDLGKERELRSLRERLRVADEKIASLSTGVLTPAAVVKSTTEHGYKCGIHPQVIVDDELDRVTCSVCGEALPAIDVLRAIAHEEMNFCRWNDDAPQGGGGAQDEAVEPRERGPQAPRDPEVPRLWSRVRTHCTRVLDVRPARNGAARQSSARLTIASATYFCACVFQPSAQNS